MEQAYRLRGLTYRPRYTPVMRALAGGESASIRAIASAAGLTHSAVSQTVAQMKRDGLVDYARGADARERLVALSPAGLALLPELRECWAATHAAAHDLMREIGVPLDRVVTAAITALYKRRFLDRIDAVTADR